MPILSTSPLISDAGASPPRRFHGRFLAVGFASAIAALPGLLALGSARAFSRGKKSAGVALLGAGALALAKIGALLVDSLRPAWHSGLAFKTNLTMFALYHVKGADGVDLWQLSPARIARVRAELGRGAKLMYRHLISKAVAISDVALDDAEAADLVVPSLPPFARLRPVVKFRVYRPTAAPSAERLPCLVFAHGGGMAIGSCDTHEHITSRLAEQARCVVVSCEYRMMPDIELRARVRPLRRAAPRPPARRRLRRRRARLGVGGDSAGGNLAATVALLARDAGIALSFQLLVYPFVYGGLSCSESLLRNKDAPVLNLESIGRLWSMANKGRLFCTDRHAGEWELNGMSPLCAKSFAGLAPAIVISAYYDPLFDHAEEYARALRAAGVRVYYSCYYAMHGFWGGVTTREGTLALRETSESLAEPRPRGRAGELGPARRGTLTPRAGPPLQRRTTARPAGLDARSTRGPPVPALPRRGAAAAAAAAARAWASRFRRALRLVEPERAEARRALRAAARRAVDVVPARRGAGRPVRLLLPVRRRARERVPARLGGAAARDRDVRAAAAPHRERARDDVVPVLGGQRRARGGARRELRVHSDVAPARLRDLAEEVVRVLVPALSAGGRESGAVRTKHRARDGGLTRVSERAPVGGARRDSLSLSP